MDVESKEKLNKSPRTLNNLHYKSNRLQQIRGFCNVVILGSITKAANAMGLTQPAVTSQIKSLERDLCKKLFYRKGKLLVPTDDGKSFYDFVIPTLKTVDSIYEEYLIRSDHRSDNTLRIAGYYSAITRGVPRAISRMISENADINVFVNICDSRDNAIDLLRRGEFDLIWCNTPSPVPDDLKLLRTTRSNATILASVKNPISKLRRKLTIQDLQGQYFLTACNSLPHAEILQKYRTKSRITFSGFDWEGIRFFTKENIGISLFASIEDDYDVANGLVSIDASHLFPAVEYQLIGKNSKQKQSVTSYLSAIDLEYGKYIVAD